MADTGPSLGFLQKHFGPTFMRKKRKGDIQLPLGRDKKDPRLRTRLSNITEGYRKFKELRSRNAIK